MLVPIVLHLQKLSCFFPSIAFKKGLKERLSKFSSTFSPQKSYVNSVEYNHSIGKKPTATKFSLWNNEGASDQPTLLTLYMYNI